MGIFFSLHSCSWITLIFYDSLNSDILIYLIFGSFLFVLGPNGLVWGSEYSWTTVLRSAHVVEQLSFSMFPSILRFDFDLILGLFLTFGGPHGHFLGFGVGFKNCFGVYSYSWTILILYVSVNSDICFCLILR